MNKTKKEESQIVRPKVQVLLAEVISGISSRHHEESSNIVIVVVSLTACRVP